jgi:riboflavin kinase/FMN adenylyltransferase
VGDADGLFSSTRARLALEQGDLAAVERCLGRPHSLSGTVVHGAARGRTLGFPTANLAGVTEALPPFGVYACRVERLDAEGHATPLAFAVMNLGLRPTLQAGFSVEAHLFDFDADLYDQRLRVHLLARLREERKFPDLEALKAQIAQDSAAARALFATK